VPTDDAEDGEEGNTHTLFLPPPTLVRALLRDMTAPAERDQRFAPTRWLLLCCFEATHGVGCALSDVHRGVLSHALRETALVSLFVRLAGSQRRYPAAESSALTQMRQ
jgi:hypothetical protein